MRLKKFLGSLSQIGQVTLEFFILLCIIAAVSIIGGSTFFTRTRGMTNTFMNQSLVAMEQQDLSEYPAAPVIPTSTPTYHSDWDGDPHDRDISDSGDTEEPRSLDYLDGGGSDYYDGSGSGSGSGGGGGGHAETSQYEMQAY
jgi:hypothetical protein